MEQVLKGIFGLLLVFSLAASGGSGEKQQRMDNAATAPSELASETNTEEQTVTKMNVQVGDTVFIATLADNDAVDAFVDRMRSAPVVVQMNDHAGFEKVGPLGESLPMSNSQTTAQAGDIVLYNGNQIVVFYGSNSWSYTRIGKIDDLSGWEDALGDGDVSITFSLE